MDPNTTGLYLTTGKRLFDLVAATLGLLVLSLPLLLIGLLIYLREGAPVVFRQTRIGRHGRPFTICKFRTMTTRALSGSTITVAGDARITPLGRWLRRYKLDEVPQLCNVLAGTMSFVGPRPDVPGYMDKLQGEARALLALRPGITGPATLAFRNEEELLAKASDPTAYNDEIIFPTKVALNLAYLKTVSLALDLRLILQTVFVSHRFVPIHDTEADFRAFAARGAADRPTPAAATI